MKTTYIIVIGRITNYCEKINYKIFKEDVYDKRLALGDEKRVRESQFCPFTPVAITNF